MYKKTHALVESAIMIALATVLSYVKVWEMPMGRRHYPVQHAAHYSCFGQIRYKMGGGRRVCLLFDSNAASHHQRQCIPLL